MSKNESTTSRVMTGFYLADLMFVVGCAYVGERLAAWLVWGWG